MTAPFHPLCTSAAIAARQLDEAVRAAVNCPDVVREHQRYCQDMLIQACLGFADRHHYNARDVEWSEISSKAFDAVLSISITERYNLRRIHIVLNDGSYIDFKLDLEYKDLEMDCSNDGVAKSMIDFDDADLAFRYGEISMIQPITNYILSAMTPLDEPSEQASTWPPARAIQAISGEAMKH